MCTVDFDPAEIRGFAGDRVHQGKECDPFGSGVRREEAQLRRAALLGQRRLCIHGGTRHQVIREYIRKQEEEDSAEQMNFGR